MLVLVEGKGIGLLHTSIATIPIPHEEIALRHLPQVILVQELAALAFLAQAPQPMLAH